MESSSYGVEAYSHDRSRRPDREESKVLERHDVMLDLEGLKIGDRLEGSTGAYEFSHVSDLLEENGSLLECRVKDVEGREFFVHNKRAETQVLAGVVGESVLSTDDAGKIVYPEMRLEKINGSDVVLMEWFEGYRESREHESGLTPEQKAHLVVTNLWMANVDFRPEHVLMDDRSGKVGLIDLERAFGFSDPHRLAEGAFKMPFLDDGIPDEVYRRELERLDRLGEEDARSMVARAVAKGVTPERATTVVDALFARRDAVASELRSLLDLRAAGDVAR